MRPSHRGCGPASARLVCGWLAPLLLLWAAVVAAAELPEGLSKAAVPAWVTPMPDPAPAEPGGGLRYRLVDLQLSLLDGEPQEYNDFRFDVVHRDGLEKAGRWSIQYQPRFHRVLLHHLRVVRNGRAADRLSDARIELLRPESRAGDGIYTGWRTAEILIHDVQVGDRIEIAYTLAGSNPVLGGLVHRSYTAAYSQAVGLRQVRVLAPADRPLRWRRSGPIEYEVSDRQHDGIRELVLQARPLPGIRHEGGSPGWFDGYGEIEVSNARDWAEVVAWSARLFRHQDSRAALRRLAGELSLAGRPEAEALTAALDYVQREVRYVSLSIGESSHAPAPPATTLARRYGDCKDKSLLLVGLLAEAGIQAEPVLVNTGLREHVSELLAGPQAFDHAVVRARIDGRWIYVDPTRDPESGELAQRAPLGYGEGLAVAAGGQGLVSIDEPVPARPEVEVQTQWALLAPGEDGQHRLGLEVVTDYRYGQANAVRARFRIDGADRVGADYLDYMRGRYVDIEAESVPALENDAESNTVRVSEVYRMPLEPDKDQPRALGEANLRLFQIEDWLPGIRDTRRRWPLALGGPRHGRQVIRMPMDGGWDIEAEQDEIDNPYFRFRRSVSVQGNTLVIEGDWQRLGDHVPAEDYERARADLRRVYDLMDYGVSLGSGGRSGRPATAGDLVWLGVATLGLALLLTLAWLARRQHPLAGIFYLPRQAAARLLAPPGYVKAVLVLLLAGLVSRAFQVGSTLMARQEVNWGLEVLQWLAGIPGLALTSLMTLLALRVLGVRTAFGRIYVVSAWAMLPYAGLMGLGLVAAWPMLGMFADPALMPGGEIWVRVLLVLVLMFSVLLGLAWMLFSWVVALSEASGASIGRSIAATALVLAGVFLLAFLAVFTYFALNPVVRGLS